MSTSSNFALLQSIPHTKPIVLIDSYVGKPTLVQLLPDDGTRKKVNNIVMKNLLQIFRDVSVMPTFLMKTINKATTSDRLKMIYETALKQASRWDSYLNYDKLFFPLGSKKKVGFESFLLMQSAEILRAFRRVNGLEYLSLVAKEKGVSVIPWQYYELIRMISKDITYFKEFLKLVQKRHFLKECIPLKLGEKYLQEKAGKELLQQLAFIKECPEKIARWIKNAYELHDLNFHRLEYFFVPDWINLFPNLKSISIDSCSDIQFPSNFNSEKLEKFYVSHVKRILFGKPITIEKLRTITRYWQEERSCFREAQKALTFDGAQPKEEKKN